MPDPDRTSNDREPAVEPQPVALDEEELLDRCARCLRLGGSCCEARAELWELGEAA